MLDSLKQALISPEHDDGTASTGQLDMQARPLEIRQRAPVPYGCVRADW